MERVGLKKKDDDDGDMRIRMVIMVRIRIETMMTMMTMTEQSGLVERAQMWQEPKWATEATTDSCEN